MNVKSGGRISLIINIQAVSKDIRNIIHTEMDPPQPPAAGDQIAQSNTPLPPQNVEPMEIQEDVKIEDLPLDKKLEQLKKYSYIDYYDEGRYIDAQDTVNTWCLGQVIQVIDKTVRVHYDGWSSKWDLTAKIGNYKLAPFRKFSRGYTGQVRTALRQNLKFSLDELAIEKQRVQKIIDDDYCGYGAFNVTQYFRGQLYIYLDFLLQNNKYQPDEVDAINDFVYTVLRFIIGWFRRAKKLIPLYSQIKLNSDLFLIDENIAVLQCAFEISDMLKKILGGCHRCFKYYLLNDKAAIAFENPVTNSYTHVNFEENNQQDEDQLDNDKIKEVILTRKNIVYGQLVNFLNFFAQEGGFDAIVDFLRSGNEAQEEKIPLDLISLVVSPFRTCNTVFSQSFSSQFTQQVRDIFQQRLQTMTEKELKEIDKESVSRVLKELKDFLTLSMNDMETAQFIEMNQLNMSFRFLRSTYLEKKLKGLQEIKIMISAIENQQTLQLQKQKLMSDPQYAGRINFDNLQNLKEKPPKYITAESLKEWILNQKLLDIVFGENTHVEIVKRSGCILKFLAKQGSLPAESVDLLWKCQLGKHEDMVRVVYSTIQEIVPSLDVPIVDLFYQRITQVPASQYDDKFLEFLKDFTQKALANYHDFKATEQSMDEEHAASFEEAIKKRENHVFSHIQQYLSNPATWDTDDKAYGLPIFWEMIQDRSTSTSSELTQQSIASLSEILKQPNSQPVKVSFLLRALDNILRGESVAQSIILAQNIIGDYSTFDSKDDLLTVSNIIQALAKQIDIVNKIILNIESYHAAVKERARSLIEKNKSIPDDVSGYVFVGKHTHKETLDAILGFLEFIVLSSDHKVTLGTANIDRLWTLFVQQPNFNSDQTLYLQWINKHRENYHSENLLFNEQEREHFFTKILCNRTYVDFQKITPGQAKSFHKFFKLINKVHGYIEASQKKIVVYEYDKLIGLEPLRQIAIESENERTKDDSMDLLVDLHLKFDSDKTTAERQSQIWANFIQSCMQQLESADDRLVSNTLQLLSKFLDRYEGKKTFKTDSKQTYGGFNQIQMPVILRPDGVRKNINVSYQQSIGQIRLKIAEAFGFQVNEFQMGIKNVLVDPDEEDDKLLREYGIIQNIALQKNIHYNPDLHPKKMISQKQENYDKLFSLLTKDSKSHLVEATWDLLQKLPTNEKLLQEIKDLSGMQSMNENKQIWEKLLDPKSINKLLYSLQIVSQINGGGNRKDQKPNQWRYKFIQMGGLQHLMRTFLSLNVPSIESNLTIKCIQNLIVTLHDVMNAERDKDSNSNVQLLLDKKDMVVDKCFHLVDLIADYVINLEKQRGESYEEIQRRIILNKIKKNKYKSYMAVNVKQQQSEKQEEEEDHESAEYNLSQQIIKQFDEQQKIVTLLFQFLQITIFQQDRNASIRVAQYENLSKMLLKTTLQNENFHIRLEVLNKIKDIISNRSGTPEVKPMLRIVSILTLEIQPEAAHFESRCNQFYEGLTQIIDILTIDDIRPLREPLVQMIQELGKFVLNRELREKNTTDTDHLLVGKMKLLKSLLQKFPEQKRIVGEYLTHHLIHDCLFEIPHGSGIKSQTVGGPPKCKTSASRSAAFKLLSVLCRDTLYNLDLVLNYLNDFNQHPSWRTHKDQDWMISLMDSEKSSTGYVGIKNLGCICYMNSLFQQLFMIRSLRNDILSVPEDKKQDKDENMFYQLQLLFAGLLKSEKQYVNPKGFCHAFKDWDGNPTNVLEQMDVEEFFNMLMDRIETAIKGSAQQDSIKQHFGGKYANEMICKGCPHKYDRTEDFLTIQVPVKNQKSLQQGLLATVQGEMLEGENAYYCEKCDKKVDTLKRQCIKRLPRFMMLPLKRFEFDYDKMIRVKVNENFEFPLEINMEPYTSEGLSKRERIQKAKEEKGDEEAQAIIDEIEKEPSKYPKEYYEYQLSGIVVHSGTADSGHYYSFIKDRDHPESGKWYEMNDSMVRDFDPKEIPAECFGGEDTFTGYNMMQMKSVRYRNAYLLFYERKTPIEVVDEEEKEAEKSQQNVASIPETAKNTEDDVEMSQSMSSKGLLGAIPSVAINSEIEQKITYENQKYWQNRFLFGAEYHEFVQDISLYWNTSNIVAKNYLSKNNDFKLHGYNCPKEYEQNVTIPDPLDVSLPIEDKKLVEEFELRVFKFTASCYLTILQRGSNKMVLPPVLNLLKSYINKNERCAEWLINEMCNYELLDELLLQCTSKEMRAFAQGLIYCSLLKFYPYEKDRILDYWTNIDDPSLNNTKIGNFALVMIQNIYNAKAFSLHSTQYLQVISRLASLGPEIREFFLRAKGVGRMLQFFFDDISPHHEYFREMSDIRPIYNAHPEMGLPTVTDKKQMTQFQELIEKKRLKAIAEGTPKYKYLFEAVSYMIRGYRHGQPIVGSNMPQNTPYQLDQGSGEFQDILQQERDLFFPDPKFIKKMFQFGQKTKAIIALCKSYTHFTWYDKDEFAAVLEAVKIGLTENDHLEAKPFFCMIWFLLKNPGGEKAENRFEQTINFFLEQMLNNQVYYKFMEACYEFLFKLCAGVPSVFQWFRTNPDKWSWIIEYSQKISFPVDQTTQVRLYKKKSQYAQYPQYLRNEAYKNQFLQNARNNRLQMILKGNLPGNATELENWLNDMEDYKFRVGEQFELYQKKSDSVQIMQVELVLDEILHLKNLSYNASDNYNQQSQMLWLPTGSNKIQPLGVYNAQYRLKLIELYEKSHEQKVRAAQGANQMMRQGDDDQVMNYRNQGGVGGGQYNNNNDSDEDDSEDEDHNV